MGRIEEITKKAKRLNQRYRNLEKQGLQYVDYSYIKVLKGEKTSPDFIGKTGYFTQGKARLRTFTDEQLDKYESILDRQLESVSVKKAKRIYTQSWEKTKENETLTNVAKELGVEFTLSERDELLHSGFLDMERYDSTQIITAYLLEKSDGVSLDEFMRKYQSKYVETFTPDEYKRWSGKGYMEVK